MHSCRTCPINLRPVKSCGPRPVVPVDMQGDEPQAPRACLSASSAQMSHIALKFGSRVSVWGRLQSDSTNIRKLPHATDRPGLILHETHQSRGQASSTPWAATHGYTKQNGLSMGRSGMQEETAEPCENKKWWSISSHETNLLTPGPVARRGRWQCSQCKRLPSHAAEGSRPSM